MQADRRTLNAEATRDALEGMAPRVLRKERAEPRYADPKQGKVTMTNIDDRSTSRST